MAHHEDAVVQEEEDLGTAMQKLPIPFKEFEQLPIESVYGFADGVREIIEDSNLLVSSLLTLVKHVLVLSVNKTQCTFFNDVARRF